MKTNGKSSAPNISLSVEYNYNDFAKAIHLMKANSVFRVVEKIFASISGVFAVYYLYLSLVSNTQTTISASLILLLFLMSIFLWFDVSVYLSAWRAFRLFKKQDINNVEFEIDKDGISSKTNLSSTHANWGKFVDSYENDELYVIVLITKNFLIFPKRTFNNNEDIESLRIFLYSNISK